MSAQSPFDSSTQSGPKPISTSTNSATRIDSSTLNWFPSDLKSETVAADAAEDQQIFISQVNALRDGTVLDTNTLNAFGKVFGLPRIYGEDDMDYSQRMHARLKTYLPTEFKVFARGFTKELGVSSLVSFALVGLMLMVESKKRTGFYGSIMHMLKESDNRLVLLSTQEFYAALTACLLAIVAANGVTVSVLRLFRKIAHNGDQKIMDSIRSQKIKQLKEVYIGKPNWTHVSSSEVAVASHKTFLGLLSAFATGQVRTVKSLASKLIFWRSKPVKPSESIQRREILANELPSFDA